MKIWKHFLALSMVAVVTTLLFTGCGESDISQGAAKNDYPIVINDVTLSRQPTGVAVLSQSIADVILAEGFEATLKAKSADCTQEDLSVLDNVTIDDAAVMKKLGVTLVLVDQTPTQEQSDALQEQGIQVLAIAPAKSREDCKRLYREVGSAMQGGNTGYTKGEKVCENLFYTLDDITRLLPVETTQSTACYLYNLQGGAATGDSLFGGLISYAGFYNVFENDTGGQVEIGVLQIANPYYIFCPNGLKEQLRQAEDFQELDAVKNDRVYEMEPELMQRQGKTIMDAVTAMVKSVHPELFVTKESKKQEAETAASQTEETESTPQNTVEKPWAVSSAGTLDYGSSGEAVRLMQKRLRELGYLFTAVNGLYDEGTTQAVRDFQLLNGFATSGTASQELLDVMFSKEAVVRESH